MQAGTRVGQFFLAVLPSHWLPVSELRFICSKLYQ